jgi:tungstate transport system ATP-binding protein
LSVRGLGLERGGKWLLRDVNLDLQPGRLSVVMGPNGAGKSILLRLLHGLIAPSQGEVQWDGAVLSDAVRKRQAMVFQRPVLLRRSVAANIDFVLEGPAHDKRARCEAVLSEAGLLEKADQPARSLSGGEQQRLALARALALRPQVLFLDEPSASLDPASTLAIERVVLRAHHDLGTKIVFVTHDPGQARRLADEVVFLDKGRLVEQTPSARFFDQPETEAAQAFLDGRLAV